MTVSPLVCHAQANGAPSLTIEAAVRHSADGLVVFDYRVRGDISALRIPPLGEAQRTDGLWRHTCFEAFIRDAQGATYVEFNFSPSTHWAIYAFDRYREGMRPVPVHEPPVVTVQSADDHLSLRAAVPAVSIRGAVPAREHLLALSGVIEDRAGALSYWALAHPPGRPDFHHDAGFIMRLEGLHP